MNLDTSRILNTDSKVLANALVELAKTENTIDAAQKYSELYKNQPLSFIIDNSEQIFVEPRKGLDFYRDHIKLFPLWTLCDELAKVTNYVHDHKDQMHPMLADSYGKLVTALRNRIHDTNCFGVIEDTILRKNPENRSRIMALCDLLYKAGDDDQNSEDDNPKYAQRDREHIEAFNRLDKLALSLDPVISLIYMSVSPKGKYLRFCARNVAKSMQSGGFAKTMESAVYVNMFSSNELFQEAVNEIRSADARCILQGLVETNVIGEFNSYAESVLADDTPSVEVTLDSFVEAAMADLQETKANADDNAVARGEVTVDKLAIYESVLDIVTAIYERCEPDEIMEEFPLFTQIKESVGVTGDITVEDALKLIVEATAVVEEDLDSLMQEYTIDGRPGKVISRHNASTRFNEDITRGVNSRPKPGAPGTIGANTNYDDDYDSATIPNSSRLTGSAGMPSAANPNARNPVKPKPGLFNRITNKAMDANAAAKQRTSKIKAVGQTVVGAGKAVLKVPSGVKDGISNFANSINEMDDNHRKEYMIRPGFRKKIFKNIRVALMYGATASVSALYLPIAWFARKMSKEKNKRIRNEFAAELETEIKVIEAKMEDANSKGDPQQRYELIRLKDKLTRDLARVKYNAKTL